MKFFLFIFTYFFVGSVFAFDESKIQTYVKLLKAGCSVDMDTELDVTADGKLVILKKTKVGGVSFDLKSSETQNILNALKNDSLKDAQATEQRTCQQHYLDKIFAVLIPNQKKPEKIDLSKSGDGYLFELRRCMKIERNSVNCEFTLASSFYDRKIRLMSHMYDNFGNFYKASSISVANFQKKNYYLDASLIADVATLVNIKFTNVNTQATGISKLQVLDSIEFRDLPIISR